MPHSSALVVSEPDIEAALTHLRSLPYRNPLPKQWEREHFLSMLREAFGKRPKVGQCVSVGPGLFAIVEPFGVDLAGQIGADPDGRLQVWLSIRSCGTDPGRITIL